MSEVNGVRGLANVLSNLRAQTYIIPGQVNRGLYKAGLFLQAKSQKLVPVNTGNLKASAFTRLAAGRVSVGYTAGYAVFVHEAVKMKLKGKPRPNNKGKFWDPQGKGQAKFLEAPFRNEANRRSIIQIVKRAARV